jgi:hypothetical protein
MKFHTKVKAILNIDVTVRHFELYRDLSAKFPSPVLFYLSSDCAFLTTYVKIDFKDNTLTYYRLLSDYNLTIAKDHKMEESSVHSSLSIGDKGFFNFYSLNPLRPDNIITFIDFETSKCIVFSANDIFDGEYDYINESAGLDHTRPGHFFLGVKPSGTNKCEIYSCSFDLQDKVRILDVDDRRYSPHDIKEFNGVVFSTEFFDQRFGTKDGLVFNDGVELYSKLSSKSIRPYIAYELFKQKHKLEPLDGKLLVYDMSQSKTDFRFLSTGFCPSHIEIIDDNMYVSSHNFALLGGIIVYLDTASIDLYKIANGDIKFVKKFQDPVGFRFTAHKVFKRNGHPYIVTIGHPNRLFLVDGVTMTKVNQIDLGGENILDNIKDIKNVLNSTGLYDTYDPLRFSTVEVSVCGGSLVYWDTTSVHLLDMDTFETRPIINFHMDGFRQKTYHSAIL